MKNNKNKVVRAIILNKEGKVLLGKRTQGKGAGGWALVGGRPEENETPEATIVREVQEELGIKFNPHFYFEETDKEPFPGEFWDVVYFQGYFAGEIMLNDENSEEKFSYSKSRNKLLFVPVDTSAATGSVFFCKSFRISFFKLGNIFCQDFFKIPAKEVTNHS